MLESGIRLCNQHASVQSQRHPATYHVPVHRSGHRKDAYGTASVGHRADARGKRREWNLSMSSTKRTAADAEMRPSGLQGERPGIRSHESTRYCLGQLAGEHMRQRVELRRVTEPNHRHACTLF